MYSSKAVTSFILLLLSQQNLNVSGFQSKSTRTSRVPPSNTGHRFSVKTRYSTYLFYNNNNDDGNNIEYNDFSDFSDMSSSYYDENNDNEQMSTSVDDCPTAAEVLPLSVDDWKRLSALQSRNKEIPIIIMDAMLPKQKLTFESSDPRFSELIDYVVSGPEEIGMIGFNPHTGRPLNMGVTIKVTEDMVKHNGNSIEITVRGGQCFEVQGEPYMDETSSFYKAKVEVVDDREETITLSEDQMNNVHELANRIPDMVSKWISWVIKSGKTDLAGINMRMDDIGPMPTVTTTTTTSSTNNSNNKKEKTTKKNKDVKELAFWVAALVNPIPALGVCLEIRPAMLSCRNDHDRMILATAALQSSIDHLSGKKKLF